MALRGNLKDFSLPDVFQLVTFSRKTGVLRIRRENDDEGSVWFRDGDVFFAQSNWHTELLGERLVRAQRLTPQALAKALDIRATEPTDGRRLGQILVDEGYLTEKVLEVFVSEQIQETIFDLMRWDEGEFDFEAMPEAVEEDIGLSISIENVIMEGSRRLEEWARIRKKIPSMDVVFKMATAPGEGTFEISLKPTEWNLLLLVDGTRSVADLAYATERTDFEVARIVYGLFSAGLLEFASDEEVARLRAERDEREAKLAAIEAERRKVEEATAAREATRADQADGGRGVATEGLAEEGQPMEGALPSEPVEEPEFLVGGVTSPTAEDAAVLEEMMGAVLRPPGGAAAVAPEEPLVPPTPHTPAEEPAFMAVEHVEEFDLPLVPVPSVDDLLTDFADLRQTPESVDAAAEAVAEAVAESPGEIQAPIAPEVEPEPAAPEAVVEVEPEPAAPEAVVEVEPEPVAPETVAEVEPEPAAPEVMAAEMEPEPVAPEAAPTEPVEDFERDLMALGLGELPADLGGVAQLLDIESATTPAAEAAAAEAPDLSWIAEAEEPTTAPPPEPASEGLEAEIAAISELADIAAPAISQGGDLGEQAEVESPDFSELLESLDIDSAAEEASEAPVETFEPLDFDEELLGEVAEESGGVISTDAFLEDITVDEMALTGEMTDELSALTGATRPGRPQANVNRIPDSGSGEVLRRDARVDRDTLMKIIDGIKNL